MRETQQLLQEYADTGSESAFRELVQRYIDLVYSTARRLVGGDAHLAQDVAQTVFIHLSRKAGKLGRDPMLGGWLHRDTCFVAIKTLRADCRRQAREREAALMNSPTDHSKSDFEEFAPFLDQAVNRLGGKDRLAIVLRFFEQRDFRAIGVALGSNEDAARMRVNRALEKLQVILTRRGVVLSAGALAVALTGKAVSAAPIGLGGGIAGTVLAGAAGNGGLSASLLKLMAMTKLKYGLAGSVVIAGVATSLVLQHEASATQRRMDDLLQRQSDRLEQLSAEKQRLAELATQTNDTTADQSELLKLRAEAASLRPQLSGLPGLRQENKRLLARAAKPGTPLQATEEAMAKGSFVKNWMLAFMIYAQEHNGWFPTNFEQAASFLQSDAKSETNINTAQFEIVYQGTRNGLVEPSQTIVFREKEPWLGPRAQWAKVYGFGDGSAQLHSEPEGNFENYERQHLAPLPASGR